MLSRMGSNAAGQRPRDLLAAIGRVWRAVLSSAVGVMALWPLCASAQSLPSEPFAWWDGRAVMSGDITVSLSESDPGWFNDADYGHNVLRLATGGVSGSARLGRHVTALGEVRFENGFRPRLLSWFARVRPWTDRPIDIQVGRIPPVFGTFARRRYGVDNPLIGHPLAYQYLTTLRADAVPASPEALLAVRGDGWFVRYPSGYGATSYHAGLPLVSALNWDTGVQVRIGDRPIELAVSATTGSLAAPRLRDDNRGKQFAARLALRPAAAVTLGVSASTGAYLARAVTAQIGGQAVDREYAQRVVGADVEVSRDHWLLRGELIASAWQMPTFGTGSDGALLRAFSWSAESRYRLRPDVYVASRVEHLSFSEIRGSALGSASLPWEAPVTRVELGGGFYLARTAIIKLVVQQNWRDVLPDRQGQRQLGAQLSYWF